MHHGQRNDLLYYRDSNNNEIDLLVPDGSSYIAAEIKAGHTISSSFFKGIRHIKTTPLSCDASILIYKGNERRKQFDTEVVNIHTLAEVISTLVR